jgi:hypothetical protein
MSRQRHRTPAPNTSQSSTGNVSDPGTPPDDDVPARAEEPIDLERLRAELGVLMATDRSLMASEERRRSWLVGEIAKLETARDLEAGIADARALLEAWELRVESPLPFPFGDLK